MIAPGDIVTISGELSPFYFSDPAYQELLSDLTSVGVNYNFDYQKSDTSEEALVIISSPEFLLTAIDGNRALLLSINQKIVTVPSRLLQKT